MSAITLACPQCQAPMRAGARFCRSCGTHIQLCPECQHPMRADAKFCRSCGLKLRACPHCQQLLRKNAQFCTACGTVLTPEAHAPAIATPLPIASPAEQEPIAPISPAARKTLQQSQQPQLWQPAEQAPVEPAVTRTRRVGLFVDYENICLIRWIRFSGMSAHQIGEVLNNYAEDQGQVVFRCACVHPAKVPDYRAIKADLLQLGYSIKKPGDGDTRELKKDTSQKNQSDHVLIRQMNVESRTSHPDIFLIVSGDGDYYEHIEDLIEQGYEVRMCASFSDMHLSNQYRRLTQKYGPDAKREEGKGMFAIDNLDTLFQLNRSS